MLSLVRGPHNDGHKKAERDCWGARVKSSLIRPNDRTRVHGTDNLVRFYETQQSIERATTIVDDLSRLLLPRFCDVLDRRRRLFSSFLLSFSPKTESS